MAPSRGTRSTQDNAVAVARGSLTPRRRTPRSTRKEQKSIPNVYQDLVDEATTSPASESDAARPLKKRRTATASSLPSRAMQVAQSGNTLDAGDATEIDRASITTSRPQQTVEASSDDEDDDFEFEDVALQNAAGSDGLKDDDSDGIQDVSVSIDPKDTPGRLTPARRKPATVSEKAHMLHIHKTHLLCLLVHAFYVNSWCNNAAAHHMLRTMLNAKTISFLNPKETESQFRKNEMFMDGLQQAFDTFKSRFRVTASGMRSARWLTEDGEDKLEDDVLLTNRRDFVHAAQKLQGSQDTGNQLFCALLRSVGVDARLVCSVQTLPLLMSTTAKVRTPKKPTKRTIYAMASDTDPASDLSADDASIKSSASIGSVPPPRRRIGQPSLSAAPVTAPPPPRKKPVRKLAFPIWWVEAFNAAHQKWIPIDPVVTGTMNRASKLEPPSSYSLNNMSYVIAFEDDGVVRDVTRRYAKAYNAKTRRNRVEVTESGTTWFKQALRLFRRRRMLDRDQVEDAELVKREAAEGFPANVQDFKDHPLYALERHLKRNEVIHPRRELGKVNAGTPAKPRMEAVFRRKDVVLCRSADKWYRLGREVQASEQPVKHVAARRIRREDSTGGDEQQTGLYAAFQTQQYVPSAVVNGKVPRNAYGNLDVYVPSMVPPGGTHVRHALAQKAAKLLVVDFADAVTGFQFKGRHGTAVIQGVIVASEAVDAVHAVIEGFEDVQQEDEDRSRSLAALKLWKRFLIGLRIKERIKGYGGGGDHASETLRKELNEAEDAHDDAVEAGGFLPDEGADQEALPTAGRFSLNSREEPQASGRKTKRKMVASEDSEDDSDEFMPDAASAASKADVGSDGDIATRRRSSRRTRIASPTETVKNVQAHNINSEDEILDASYGNPSGYILDDDLSGGFIPDELEHQDDGGGFVPDEVDYDKTREDYDDSAGQDDLTGGFVSDVGEAHDRVEEGEDMVPGLHQGQAGLDTAISPIDTGDTDLDHVEVEVRQSARSRVQADKSDGYDENEDTTRSQSIRNADNVNVQSATGLAFTTAADDKTTDGRLELPITHPVLLTTGVLEQVGADDNKDTKHPSSANSVEEVQSDKASLLSHDPEDEDAEPDWLESD